MKFKPHDFFKKHPEIEEIAIRLEDSEKDAKEKNKEIQKKKKAGIPNEDNTGTEKKTFVYRAECGVISHFSKDGRWEQTPYIPKEGRDPFLKDLAKILESRDPDAIKIEIYKGKTKKKGPVYSKDIYLATNPAELKEISSGLGCPENFESSIEKIRSTVNPNSYELELLRKDFDARLKAQEHDAQIRELKLQHQHEINDLQAVLKERNEIIEELEEELDEYDGALNGLKEEKEDSLSATVIGRVLTQAGENILKNNPKIMKVGLGLTDDEIKKIWEGSGKRIEAGKASDSSSFSENSSDESLEKLDSKHAQGIRDLVAFFKQVKMDEFRKIFAIDVILQDEKTGFLNNELADKILLFIKENQPTENETPESDKK